VPQRCINEEFIQQFESGILQPILDRLQHDDTLSLEIRNGYVNIYYRGGNLLKLTANSTATSFTAFFDVRYCGGESDYRCWLPAEPPPARIASADGARAWVDAFSHYKQAMDIRFLKHPKIEREYQQAVVRDNNRHTSGDRSDYTIVDIEYAQSPAAFPERQSNFRFDMVGLRWPVEKGSRRSGIATPVILEMKTGDAALSSHAVGGDESRLTSGLAKHVRDIEGFLAPDDGSAGMSGPYRLLRAELLNTFHTKQRLRLPSIPGRMREVRITELTEKPEVLFVIANHQPRSEVFARELQRLPDRKHADYYVAGVEWMGYALFARCRRPLEEFITEAGDDEPAEQGGGA
jgi:hypothetical protein